MSKQQYYQNQYRKYSQEDDQESDEHIIKITSRGTALRYTIRAASLFIERKYDYVIFKAAGNNAIETLDQTIKRIRKGIKGLHQFREKKTLTKEDRGDIDVMTIKLTKKPTEQDNQVKDYDKPYDDKEIKEIDIDELKKQQEEAAQEYRGRGRGFRRGGFNRGFRRGGGFNRGFRRGGRFSRGGGYGGYQEDREQEGGQEEGQFRPNNRGYFRGGNRGDDRPYQRRYNDQEFEKEEEFRQYRGRGGYQNFEDRRNNESRSRSPQDEYRGGEYRGGYRRGGGGQRYGGGRRGNRRY